MQFRFTHLSGARQGQLDTLEATPILLGRDDGCHVKLDKMTELGVSGQHAQIDMPRDGVYQVTNLSRNGTFLNGVLVGEQPAALPNHTVIQLGRDGPRIRFDVDENVAGISFQANKERAETGKLDRRLGPAPTTEERPALRLDDIDDTRTATKGGSGFQVPLILMIVVAAIAIIGAAVAVVLWR